MGGGQAADGVDVSWRLRAREGQHVAGDPEADAGRRGPGRSPPGPARSRPSRRRGRGRAGWRRGRSSSRRRRRPPRPRLSRPPGRRSRSPARGGRRAAPARSSGARAGRGRGRTWPRAARRRSPGRSVAWPTNAGDRRDGRARGRARPASDTWRNRPADITATWSASDSASPWSWVTSTRRRSARAQRPGDGAAGVLAQAGVERGERLVEQHERRARARGPGRARPAAAARRTARAGSGSRPTPGSSTRSSTRVDPRAGRGRSTARQAEADVGGHVEVREERTLLRDVADRGAAGGHRSALARDHAVADRDGARRRGRGSRRPAAAAWSCRSPTARAPR